MDQAACPPPRRRVEGGLAHALEAARTCDALRAEPEGYWVHASWASIASDLGGHHLMIDDEDGRVLSVAHDDDAVRVLAESPEAWIQALLSGHAEGRIAWDTTFGLVEETVVDQVAARRATAGAEAPRDRLPQALAALLVAVGLLAVALLVAWIAAAR